MARLGRHFDGAQRVEARLFARAGDGGDFLAVITDDARAVLHGDGGLDAGNLQRGVQVDRQNFCGRPRGPKNHPVKPALGLDVG